MILLLEMGWGKRQRVEGKNWKAVGSWGCVDKGSGLELKGDWGELEA